MAQVSFSIDGAWLTEHCRNLVLEGRTDHAFRTLTDGLQGFGYDHAINLLKGDTKLVGVNDVELEDDLDSADYKDKLKWLYAGCFVDGAGRYWRPYAVVTSWGKMDFVDTVRPLPNVFGSEITIPRFKGARASFQRDGRTYADHPELDIVRHVRVRTGQLSVQRGVALGDEAVICRPMANFPYMLMEHAGLNNVEGAIQTLFDAGIMLHERGVCDYLDYEDEIEEKSKSIKVDADAARNDPDRMARVQPVLEATKTKSVDEYRKIILEQAAGDYFDLTFENTKGEKVTISVPTAPFENWALWRTNAAKLAKPWKPVSPSGMKMLGDDPYHTDWMIGAGLDLNAMHDEKELASEAYEVMWELQRNKGWFEAAILCGSKTVKGEVVYPKKGEAVESYQIAVIPNAGPDYVAAAFSAAGVITENGGTMAHLVTVSREKEITIMRVENARKKYPEGTLVCLNPSKGEVSVDIMTQRDAFGELGNLDDLGNE